MVAYQHFHVPVSSGVLHACVRATNRRDALRMLRDDDPCWDSMNVYFDGEWFYSHPESGLRPAEFNFWLRKH